MTTNAEQQRLQQKDEPWKKWGPYLSERQWGTVREDYSEGGDAWDYFSHDQARSRAYRWGEDGLAGISDDKLQLCFALALWNGKDPILKERLFGLTNSEGNHGEDVKEYYFYLDSTPTHSYMKYLYKYPQAAYPYGELIDGNRHRSRNDPEYELIDTGIFEGDRYFDIFVEYAKNSPEEILVQITVINRGPEAAELHLLPTLWFRNNWSSWMSDPRPKPLIARVTGPAGATSVKTTHSELADYYLHCGGDVELLFTENETNNARLFPEHPNSSPYVKDGINNYLVNGQEGVVNPDQNGTKAAAHYKLNVAGGESVKVQLYLTPNAFTEQKGKSKSVSPFGKSFDETFAARLQEADEFYAALIPSSLSADATNVMRQGLAGMLWSKQFYFFDADNWLAEHHAHPLQPGSRRFRNREWYHMFNQDIISMPDKWEYPWFAAWDLAFHTVALATVDLAFAKEQLALVLSEIYLHPNGQLPAYEWNFSDVNPPVHAWAALYLHRSAQLLGDEVDWDFLKSSFHKLLMNFTWWVNRKDRFGQNVFEGGFLGLDNIGVFDRSAPLPTGGYLEQADGTAWMALFCQNMAEIAVELAAHDPTYETFVFKFVEHFAYIAAAMNQPGNESMWDEEDGFYYDLLRLPDGSARRLKVRSVVGLLPLCATTVIEKWQRELVPKATSGLHLRGRQMPELVAAIHPTGPGHLGVADRGIIALLNPDRLRRILTKMLDENEFLSPYGIRSLSKFHQEHPYVFGLDGQEYRVDYLPAESNTGMFGGNSNWRGPIWMPINALIIRALQQYHLYYGDNFQIECPTGSGKMMNLFEVSKEISGRLSAIFFQNEQGRRPVYGGTEKFQSDPHWRDYLLFYEYFHGDNGAGLGASHQTGWTGIVTKGIQLYALLDAEKFLTGGKMDAFQRETSPS